MRIVDMREKERWLEARQQELGLTGADFVAARNNGSRRTPEKRALLRRLAEVAASADAAPALPAHIRPSGQRRPS